MSKKYRATRDDWRVTVVVETSDNEDGYLLSPRWDLRKHAEDFSWGKNNCSTNQLALAVLSDHLGRQKDAEVLTIYPLFAEQVLSKIPLFQKQFELDSQSVQKWLHRVYAELALDRR